MNMRGMVFGLAMLAGATGILGQDDAVLLRVDDDLQQVRVEALDEATGRWLAIASGCREAADAGWLKIGLPDGYAGAQLRLLGSPVASPFAGRMRAAALAGQEVVAYPPTRDGWLTADGGLESDTNKAEAVIEEADVWAWEGSLLYFYNQYRGLQVIDMTEPVQPRWLDYFRYPAKGEDLYAFGGGRVVLIGTGNYWGGDKVALQFLSFAGGSLALEDTVELSAGQYMDSRRYGDFLYVMTREWVAERDPQGRSINAPLIRLYTVAIDAPAGGRLVDVQTFDGDGWLDAVLTAQQDGILLSLNRWHSSTTDWRYRWHSEVHVLVPQADGVPRLAGVARLSGIVQDKFKLNFRGGLLTAISQQADWTTGAFSRATMLENFQLGESGFSKVGGLALAPGETLFASRFYGDTVYIVTFLMVDPLFAIDNSIPSRPRVAGELKVPGWSDYLEWVDDQLFAVGIEENRLTVSIFDVADPADMRLKDRVFLSENSWAWSEAQYDDQAISFFPAARLLMLPFTTWSWKTSEQVQAMQLISWDDTGLRLRGQIAHLDTPRRGILRDEAVITISGRQLITTDITDPDLPLEGGKTTLAWNVQHLIPHNDHWLQLEAADTSYGYWAWRVPYGQAAAADPVLYVTSKDEPNIPAGEVPLAAGSLLGVAHSGNRLVLLQDVTPAVAIDAGADAALQSLAVRVYDVTNPLEPSLLGEAVLADVARMGGAFDGHLLPDGGVLWASQASYSFYGYRGMLDRWWPWYYPQAPGYMVATIGPDGQVDIPAHAVFQSGTDWYNSASGWFWAPPVLAASMTRYIERQRQEFYPVYETQTSLLAVDFSIPAEPLQLPAVRIPAGLAAIEPLPDGLNHYLYFEPQWNRVEVWGWDRAVAFALFKQDLFPGDTSRGSSHSNAWMPPFHLRYRYAYDDAGSGNFLEVWRHETAADTFVRIGDYDLNGQWLGSSAVKKPFFLQSTATHLHRFLAAFPGGDFTLLDSVQLPFPNIYNLMLDRAVLSDSAVHVPAGLYGVEVLEWPTTVPARTRAYARLEASTGDWSVLDAARWQRVPRDSEDAAGVLQRLYWLYYPDSLREIDPLARDLGDYWRGSGWFGWYAYLPGNPAWIEHTEHGPLLVRPGVDPQRDGAHLWDPILGYLWTDAATYPWLYAYNRAQWIRYEEGSGRSGPRRFFDPSAGWFVLTR